MRPTRLNANDVGIVVLVMERVNVAMGLLHVVKYIVSGALLPFINGCVTHAPGA